MTIDAYPLSWPNGWSRTPEHDRGHSKFGKAGRREKNGDGYRWISSRNLTISEATARVRAELSRMSVSDDDLVISTDLRLRLDGLPRSGQPEPDDPGAAVYWQTRSGETRCMAIDRYERVADNLAAIAATLDAMRAIERHGGAEILDRAFIGFAALPPPIAAGEPWYVVLDCDPDDDHEHIKRAYQYDRSRHHPDNGGDAAQFDRVQRAWEQYEAQRG